MSTALTAHPVVRTLPTRLAARDQRPLPRSVVQNLRDQLVAESWITAAQFQAGLRFAESQHVGLTDALVEFFHIPETAAYEALSGAAAIPMIDLDAISISPLAIQLIPERIARRCGAMPVAEDNRTLTFATSQPFSTETDQDISFASGRHPKPMLARPSQIAAALDKCYPHGCTSDRSVAPFRPRVEATTKKKRVLVADDDRMIRMLVRILLQKEGYDVAEAQNGREAVQAALALTPDLLIADLVMPEVDGYEAVASLRSETSSRHLPVIVLTAEPTAVAEKTVLFLGADDYVTKPFDAEVLLGRVRSVFVRRLPIAC